MATSSITNTIEITNKEDAERLIGALEKSYNDSRLKCHICKYKGEIEKSEFIYCKNRQAVVEGHPSGIVRGYFDWPYNFHPVWLKSCTGFQAKGVKDDGNKNK